MLSKIVTDIRTNWAISDRERDEGLTTPEDITRHDDISYGPYGEWNLLDIYHKKDRRATMPTTRASSSPMAPPTTANCPTPSALSPLL